MEKKLQVLITFIFIILLITGLYLFTDWFSKVTGYFSGESDVEKLAACLDKKGAEFYGSVFSPETEKQAKLFGKHFQKINYIDCGKDKEYCPNIREIPAWYIDKKIYYGFKNLTELDSISNCNVLE